MEISRYVRCCPATGQEEAAPWGGYDLFGEQPIRRGCGQRGSDRHVSIFVDATEGQPLPVC
jgi:hypothetical protein